MRYPGAGALVLILLAACSNGTDGVIAPSAGPGGGTTGTVAHSGDFAGPVVGSEKGRFVVTALPGNTIGTVAFRGWFEKADGTTVVLDGTGTILDYAFSVSGGGYHFAGGQMPGGVGGGFTGPSGTGVFIGFYRTQPGTFFCGSYSGDRSGSLDLGLRSDVAMAGLNEPGRNNLILNGTYQNGVLAFSSPGVVDFIGAISGDTASGTWTEGTATGTWQANRSDCAP